ncbi:hypothetical protein ES703_53972 [subsurface metagenome]
MDAVNPHVDAVVVFCLQYQRLNLIEVCACYVKYLAQIYRRVPALHVAQLRCNERLAVANGCVTFQPVRRTRVIVKTELAPGAHRCRRFPYALEVSPFGAVRYQHNILNLRHNLRAGGHLGDAPFHRSEGAAALRVAEGTRLERQGVDGISRWTRRRHRGRVWNGRISAFCNKGVDAIATRSNARETDSCQKCLVVLNQARPILCVQELIVFIPEILIFGCYTRVVFPHSPFGINK